MIKELCNLTGRKYTSVYNLKLCIDDTLKEKLCFTQFSTLLCLIVGRGGGEEDRIKCTRGKVIKIF